jgi:hypothetical protein
VIIDWQLPRLAGSCAQKNSWCCSGLGCRGCVCLTGGFHPSRGSKRGLLLGVARPGLASSSVGAPSDGGSLVSYVGSSLTVSLISLRDLDLTAA